MSLNFPLEELTDSNTARLHGFMEQFTPPMGVIKNLTALADHILQPLRDEWKRPITVNCGYRCPRTNRAVGGVSNSQHLEGQAADITVGSPEQNKLLFNLVIQMKLPFDQLILEKGGQWIHVSYNASRTRGQILYT